MNHSVIVTRLLNTRLVPRGQFDATLLLSFDPNTPLYSTLLFCTQRTTFGYLVLGFEVIVFKYINNYNIFIKSLFLTRAFQTSWLPTKYRKILRLASRFEKSPAILAGSQFTILTYLCFLGKR